VASQTDICNLALSFLGSATITTITDSSTAARVLIAEYEFVRDAELRAHTWRFAIKRAALPALAAPPLTGPFLLQYQLPADCLKILVAGDYFPSADMSNYRTNQSDATYLVEGNVIVTSYPAPMALRYVYRVEDEGLFDASFTIAFAARLAWLCCERITQSPDKRKLAMTEYTKALTDAIRANAIEHVTDFPSDDTWILARMQ
jgi:hypothetical protein